ncbi:MAG: hypothetical protein QXM04_00600 [Nanopusillaceae archaeon]
MKNQLMVVGIFLIIIGILIFVYWILLPIPEKEKILEEIYGKENISKNNGYIAEKNSLNKNMIENIYLYAGKKEMIIAENYSLGELISFYEINFEDVSIKTNIFSGIKSKKLTFSYHEGEGIVFNFVSKCVNGKIEIFINDILFFEGCPNNLSSLYIQNEYLKKGSNNYIIIKFYPKSIFSDAIFEMKNLKIIFVKRSELSFDYFFSQNENVFLVYNFCPTDPNSLKLFINGVEIPIYSCIHNSFDITRYLNSGKNTIKFVSKVKTHVNLKIQTSSNIFMQILNLTKKDYMLYVTKNRGSGEIYINTCKFYLEPYKEVFSFFVSEKCVNNGENIIIIRPETFLEISNLLIT